MDFINTSSVPVDVYWDNGSSQVKYFTLQPGASQKQDTFSDHKWVVKPQGDNKVIAKAVASCFPESYRIVYKCPKNGPTKIKFVNEIETAVELFRVNQRNEETKTATIQPGRSHT